MTRHRFDPLSFIFGALFVAVAAVGLIDRDLLTFTDLRWIAPGLLVATGALLLVLSGRRAGSEHPSGPDGADDGTDGPGDHGEDGHPVSDAEPETITAGARSARDDAAVEGDAPER